MFMGPRHNSNHVKCSQITFKADLFLISQLKRQKSAVLYLIPSVSMEKYTILEVCLCDVTKGALMGLTRRGVCHPTLHMLIYL